MNNIKTIFKKEIRLTFCSFKGILSLIFPMFIILFALVPSLSGIKPETSPEEVDSLVAVFQIIPILFTLLIGQTAFPLEFQYRTLKFLLTSPISERELFIAKSLPSIGGGLVVNILLSFFLILYLKVRLVPIRGETLIIFFGLGSAVVILSGLSVIVCSIYFSGEIMRFLPTVIPIGIILSVFVLISFIPGNLFWKNIGAIVVIILLSLIILKLSIKGFKREILILKEG